MVVKATNFYSKFCGQMCAQRSIDDQCTCPSLENKGVVKHPEIWYVSLFMSSPTMNKQEGKAAGMTLRF